MLEAIAPDETAAIRLNLQRQHALGNDSFRNATERQLGRRAGPAVRTGRQPKIKKTTGEESAL
ncbi:hypothetical protein [Pseudoxanthomonas sp. JBR18]|uniref:hypothetical protein n=1 Tax=Pseudoxanthomonas sp. JBR18 TaxID=2969308 RepID=UPI0023064653|nr:hypothetical protein [Pseudoxanthomonas sp. JBR18]WCE06205.1 hypothetical protein PJ250_09765 [Pseudoxanthomonas sp. JBR18]